MEGRLFRGALLSLFLLPGFARADAVNAEWYSTTRALSMGNIGIASADDPTTASFYNPAALAKFRKPVFEIFNPQLNLGSGIFSLSHSVNDWGLHTSSEKAKPLLKNKPGQPSSFGFALYPYVNAQNFTLGVLYSSQSSAYYDKTTDAFRSTSRKLLIPSLGLSAGLMGSKIRIGAVVRGVQISSINKVEQGSSSSTVSVVNNSRDGFGVALDGGALLMLPWSGLPTLGFVARNIGGTSFPAAPLTGGGAVRHESIKMTYDGGLSFTPKLARKDQITLGSDYRDILNVTKTATLRKLNFGFEYLSGQVLALRLGISQGYWTAGLGFAGRNGELDLGSYGEELDPTASRSILDRRYSLRFTRRF